MARVPRGLYAPSKGPLAGQVFFSQTYDGKSHSAQSVYQDTLARHYGYRNYYDRRKALKEHKAEYTRWLAMFKHQLQRNGETLTETRRTEFERLFARLYHNGTWNLPYPVNDPQNRSSDLADFLEYIGVRMTQAFWYVGETPKYEQYNKAARVQPLRGEIEF